MDFGQLLSDSAQLKKTGSLTTGWGQGGGQETGSQLFAVSPDPQAAFSMLADEVFTLPMHD